MMLRKTATSASTENLAGGARLSRVPSLPRSSSRARSGIPVSALPASHRDLQLTRGMGMTGSGYLTFLQKIILFLLLLFSGCQPENFLIPG